MFASACETLISNHDGPWHRDCHPLRLGHVSRSWRQAAWGTSELWRTVILPLGSMASFLEIEGLLTDWLERAKEYPLDIWIQFPWRSNSRHGSKALSGILLALKKCCGRWRTIDFRLTPAFAEIFQTEDLQAFVNPFSNGLWLPRLVSLSFHSQGLESVDESLALDFQNAPNLRELYINKTITRNDTALPTCLQVPHRLIRRLTCFECPRLQLHAILATFPDLEELEFKKDLELARRPNMITIHRQLKTISVTFADDDTRAFFSPLVILPALKSIRIKTFFSMRYSNMLKSFLGHSQALLTSLHLESTEFEEEDLIATLNLIPSLTHLIIHIANYPDNVYSEKAVLGQVFFQRLDPNHGGLFLPCLEEFEYQGGLIVNSIRFLEPFILRSQVGLSYAQLRSVKIRADQQSGIRKLSIAEYFDPQYIWEVLTMIDSGRLVLENGKRQRWS
ncbi:hypothetical protein CVT24_004967 [Panaeolus cyanescens]|uniref:F-box domain-containing protein n=1 Tax=Panaeolus cyanescens TaxID=181874 RepID=A0A409YB46_9AGAR|nr:hypothetical protein CVT24_004967 [Panaeolus cyanescens]